MGGEIFSGLHKYELTLRNRNTSYFISSSEKFSEIMMSGFFYDEEKELKIGLPRNDIFFYKEESDIANKKVREKYSLNKDDLLVLFAPTFRGISPWEHGSFDMNLQFDVVKNSLEKRFNRKVIFLFRRHLGNFMVDIDYGSETRIIEVTDYPDMQELLCAADVFITDYSSCMWDFALTGKPGFLYTPDIAEYENDRGFYTPVSTWPFEHAETTEALCALIENYNEGDGHEKSKTHFETLGSYEDGHASEKICALIAEHCK